MPKAAYSLTLTRLPDFASSNGRGNGADAVEGRSVHEPRAEDCVNQHLLLRIHRAVNLEAFEEQGGRGKRDYLGFG